MLGLQSPLIAGDSINPVMLAALNGVMTMHNKEISYEDALTATEVATLVEYCKQGARQNKELWGGKISDWSCGVDLVDAYLSDNREASRATKIEVARHLDRWLASSKKRSLARLISITHNL